MPAPRGYSEVAAQQRGLNRITALLEASLPPILVDTILDMFRFSRRTTTMTARRSNPLQTFGRMFTIFSAAATASAAVRNHRRPTDETLRTLGIDPSSFPKSNAL
jgi:hypothetical protein